MSASIRPSKYVNDNRNRFVAELKKFISFPSVSAHVERRQDVVSCSTWLADHLRRIGLCNVRMVRTPGHPIVYGEWMGVPEYPTVLIYGHYDVQPAEPLDQWRTPPFKATVSGDEIRGRGASDNKGQMWAHIKAIETLLATERRLPVNVKCLFEGEEEIGSPNLKTFVDRHRGKLAADVALMSDTKMLAVDRPALTYALRGGISFELQVEGQRSELHSGNFGGAVLNPVHALCKMVARLHDRDGRISIPGFYDHVKRLDRSERDFMAANGPTDKQILRAAGTQFAWGEPGYSLYERTTIRPALTITGIGGGYQGEGVKSIIPTGAMAKFNFRLVPDQEPRQIERLFRQHIANICPPSIRYSINRHLAAYPVVIDRQHPAMQSASTAFEKGFGVRPAMIRSGGTIPIVSSFQELLGIPTVLMGFGLPDDRIHASNEKFHLPNLFRAITTIIAFLNDIAVRRSSIAEGGRRRLVDDY